MRRLQILTRTSLLVLAVAAQALASDWIVQLKNPAQASTLSQQFLSVVTGISPANGVFRISLPTGPLGDLLSKLLQSSPLLQKIEPDTLLTVPQIGTAYSSPNVAAPSVTSGAGYLAWTTQPSNSEIHLSQAQNKSVGAGVTVAVIDTGVDSTHPNLIGFVDVGPDFSGNNDPAGTLAQETSPMVDQETSPMVDQETSPMVDAKGTIILDQETSPMVDGLGMAFGHGTMVGGLVHLVAPAAHILSIKAFANDGTGTLSGIVSALYYAADHGANVINASWSTGVNSSLLQQAIGYALGKGAVVVAAVANNGAANVVYPAGLPGVVGVACTTPAGNNSDNRCSFSNYGTDVDLGAPGSGITSTFPIYAVGVNGAIQKVSNGFAMGSGTSFSTPYVSGTAALVKSRSWSSNVNQVGNDITGGAVPMPYVPGMGAGRLDANGAVAQAK